VEQWRLADFHIHTSWSDGEVSPDEVVRLYAEWGISIIAITDHLYDVRSEHGRMMHENEQCIEDWNAYSDAVGRIAQLAWKRYGMLVITGAEICNIAEDFHIVALDLKEPVDPNLSAEEVMAAVHSQGGIVIVPHPYELSGSEGRRGAPLDSIWRSRTAYRDRVDSWEIANGRDFFFEVLEANVRSVANADFHYPKQFFSWKTVVCAEKNVESVKQAIREGKTGFTSLFLRHESG